MERRSLADDFPMEPNGAGHAISSVAPPQALVRRGDVSLGGALIRPSMLTIEGPDGTGRAEPRVMQVLMAFVDAGGKVLSREDLIRECWEGRIVGDDSIHRVIGELRKLTRETGAGFAIETIPRVGYKLTSPEQTPPPPLPDEGRISRRALVIAGAGVASLAGTGGIWWLGRQRSNPQAEALIEQGRIAVREAWPGREQQMVDGLRKAVALEPGNAEAWGLLALAQRDLVEGGAPDQISVAIAACEDAARRALAIDPREGNALAALATLHPYFGDWGPAEVRLRKVVELAPDNLRASIELGTFLQAVGRATECRDNFERTIAMAPPAPSIMFRLAFIHWIFGRTAEADLVIDRALQLWPRYGSVWSTRLGIFFSTGRIDAARALIADTANRPPGFSDRMQQVWLSSLRALETRLPDDIAKARREIFEMAPRGFRDGIGILSQIGDLDAAFAVTNGLLLRTGPLVGSLWPGKEQMPASDRPWRRTMFLFIPSTAALRRDPRFAALCDGIGLTKYWKARGTGPDAFLMK